MKQLFVKKLFFVCAIATLSVTTEAKTVEAIPSAELSLSAKEPVNDIPFFKGHRQGKGVTLQWVSNNLESYVIEESTDGEFFDAIPSSFATTQKTSGSKNGRHTFNIPEVYPGETFYRIAGTLADGSVVYSEVISVRILKRK